MDWVRRMSRRMTKLLPIILAFLVGCAATPSYQSQIAAIREPRDETERQHLCGWLRQEMARQNSIMAASAGSQYALAFQAGARSNIAALEQKAADTRCTAAFGTQVESCMASCSKMAESVQLACIDRCKK